MRNVDRLSDFKRGVARKPIEISENAGIGRFFRVFFGDRREGFPFRDLMLGKRDFFDIGERAAALLIIWIDAQRLLKFGFRFHNQPFLKQRSPALRENFIAGGQQDV